MASRIAARVCHALALLVVTLAGRGMAEDDPFASEAKNNGAVSPAQAASTDVTFDQILAAWERRRQLIRSFYCQYRLKRTLADVKEWGAPGFPGDDDGEESTKNTARERVDLEKSMSLSFFDGRTMYRESGDAWSHFHAARQSQRQVQVYDGTLYRTFFEQQLRWGRIHKVSKTPIQSRNQNGLWLGYLPALWLEQVCPHHRNGATVRPGRVVRDDRECIQLSITTPHSRGLRTLYLDPNRAFLPVQMETSRKDENKVENLRIIKYQPDEQIGWKVSSWVERVYNKAGKEKETLHFKVVHSYLNPRQPIDGFEFQFPKGTRVVDHTGGGRKHFEAQGDGRRRYLGYTKIVDGPYAQERTSSP